MFIFLILVLLLTKKFIAPKLFDSTKQRNDGISTFQGITTSIHYGYYAVYTFLRTVIALVPISHNTFPIVIIHIEIKNYDLNYIIK